MEREKESKEALLHQKRRITRQWEVLARLKKRCAARLQQRWACAKPGPADLAAGSPFAPRSTHAQHASARGPCRYAAADARAAADNARLSDEYQGVTRAFAHLQRKVRHFKAADLARFEQVGGRVLAGVGGGWVVLMGG